MLTGMKKTKLFIFSLAACSLLACAWYFGHIAGENPSRDNSVNNKSNVASDNIKSENGNSPDLDDTRYYRSSDTIDFSGLKFTPWDVTAASSNVGARGKKPHTIMIYMNGSDLESVMGAATDDIIEIQESGVNTDNVNIIIFTGGTNRWNNNVIPANSCMVWEIVNGNIKKLADVGLVNMGDPGTLSSFIDFSMKNFPADKYGLIMWDHGGGSIAGFGHDEKFNNSYLTLLDINYAFEKSEAAKTKLEFLGFDSCLMSTVEMAVVASNYANFLVASEDVEPYDGWDYSFLSVLNGNPDINGAALGKSIVDSFMDYYGGASDVTLTLSVTDLSKANRLMGTLGGLMAQCSNSLLADSDTSFKTLAAKRSGTKTFGVGSPRDNECDMVDIGDMANKLSGLFPTETAAVLTELNDCVVYNRHNSGTNLKGLSAYYIYGGKNNGNTSLSTYASLNMNGNYTRYLNDFYSMLSSSNAIIRSRSSGMADQGNDALSQDEIIGTAFTIWEPVYGKPGNFIMTGIQSGIGTNSGEMMKAGMNSLWPSIDGKNVCLYNINSTDGSALYAVPSALNGKDCDIIVSFSEKYPHGKILGARQEDGIIIQKGYDDIIDGDKIAFYYFLRNRDKKDASWYKSDVITVKGELKLDWSALEGENYYSLRLTDIRHNEHYSDLKAVR